MAVFDIHKTRGGASWYAKIMCLMSQVERSTSTTMELDIVVGLFSAWALHVLNFVYQEQEAAKCLEIVALTWFYSLVVVTSLM